ncbi:uncharacterized protein M421DRAFT_419934 [Didymella exigua CBS 183.55]|uniref:CENP-Q, a CENPA-CAD centromere complex subunit-domain-containing protein n=1 Tax=Didymella exigua CBS 183.55 TaxID=1150837 RepID=A0A6A5RNN5_9PLEO|nr:uncharacterized protein M421DRAFT_419934 [Didymella exigua CBS 183.55]KAF1929402.1 hypothetical protein M421DRAFT_419934 [Didymella exigua CBS 183.55]
MARTRTADDGAKKRIGRPPGSRNSGASTSRVAKPVGAPKHSKTNSKKQQGRKSQRNDEEDELSVLAPTQTQSSRSSQTRKRTNSEVDEIVEEPTKVQKRYVQLEQRTKRISQDIIETWPHLPQHVLVQISAVIKDSKKDIANTQRDERKVMAAHNSLNPLVKRLMRHISTSRIPPQARDTHFNIDKLTERNGQVFREVTTARHSKQLLSEQVRITQNLLTKDEKDLDRVKNDARKWKNEWKHQQKNGRVHPLLSDNEDVSIDGDGPDDIRLRAADAADTSVLDAPAAELASILEQLRRSLENMQGNHGQVEGVDEAMTHAQTALDDVLFRHASAQQYDAL